MKKIIFALFLGLFITQAHAQRNNELVLNNQTIQDNLKGNWTLISVQPSDANVEIRGMNFKGVGYGEILKMKDGKLTPVISKIFATNNNSITFSDADGNRIMYKVLSMSKSTMQLTDGTVTMTFGLAK
jgi:hypothetical protein